jgi:hypothetical protein
MRVHKRALLMSTVNGLIWTLLDSNYGEKAIMSLFDGMIEELKRVDGLMIENQILFVAAGLAGWRL